MEKEKADAERSREAGNAALERGDLEEAVRLYSLALAQSPEEEKLYSNRSLAYYRLEQYEEALADAEKTIRLKPTWERGYVRKGLALERLGRGLQELLSCYEQGLQNVPSSATLRQAAQGARNALFPTSFVAKETSKIPPGGSEGTLKWNEASLAQHAAERGVLYGRMKIDHPDTPFLVYDEEMAENQNKIGTVKDRYSQPEFVDISALQKELGILHLQQEKGEDLVGDKSLSDFERRRQDIYKEEGKIFSQAVADASPSTDAALDSEKGKS